VRQLPTITGFDDYDALVFRTDYGDAETWQRVAAALAAPWGFEGYETFVYFIDDHVWAEATVDQVPMEP
jgi:hypothetical protein